MATKATFRPEHNGVRHEVFVRMKGSKCIVQVDGQDYGMFKLSGSSYWLGKMEDFPVVIDGKEYIIALRMAKIRMAADGHYIDDGTPYLAAEPIPGWAWVFVVLNLLPLVLMILIGIIPGVLPIALGFLGVAGAMSVIRASGIKSLGGKVVLAIVITAAVWAVLFLLSAAAVWAALL